MICYITYITSFILLSAVVYAAGKQGLKMLNDAIALTHRPPNED